MGFWDWLRKPAARGLISATDWKDRVAKASAKAATDVVGTPDKPANLDLLGALTDGQRAELAIVIEGACFSRFEPLAERLVKKRMRKVG